MKNKLGLSWAKLSSIWNWACCIALMLATTTYRLTQWACARSYPSYHPPPHLATPVTLAYSKIPKMTLPTSYPLTIYGIFQAGSLLSRVVGWLGGWVKLVIIRTKANSVRLDLPIGTELGKNHFYNGKWFSVCILSSISIMVFLLGYLWIYNTFSQILQHTEPQERATEKWKYCQALASPSKTWRSSLNSIVSLSGQPYVKV